MRLFTAPRASELERMSTAETRRDFLIDGLFQPGEIQLAATDLDRLIVGGAMPTKEPLLLPNSPELRSAYFTEHREVGLLNLGDAGQVTVAGHGYRMERLDCLYIGMGEPEVVLSSLTGGQAVYYIVSAPAHRKFPTQQATRAQATSQNIGTQERASQRTLVQYIHEGGIESCQLVMGFTAIAPGSVWNTWPPHTHLRRSEIYLYFDMGGELVIHFLGKPEASKHLVVREREAVLSPPWSLHTGVGTGAYSFVWAMAGENRTFADMDPVELETFA